MGSEKSVPKKLRGHQEEQTTAGVPACKACQAPEEQGRPAGLFSFFFFGFASLAEISRLEKVF